VDLHAEERSVRLPPLNLLYFSPVDWSSYAQRPHSFARHFLERGGASVTWVDPYPTRLPALSDLRRRPADAVAAEPHPRLTVVGIPAWPIEPLPGGALANRSLRWRGLVARLAHGMSQSDGIIGVGRPSALAVLALRAIPARRRFYDAMDDFPEFYSGLSRRSMWRRERAVTAAVDRIYAASDVLAAKFSRLGVEPVLVRNAYAMRTLPPWQPPPAASGPPVFGYVGTVGHWFDWEIVGRLASAFPAAEVRIVGPVYEPPPRSLPGNVRLLGACPQGDAVEHLRGFSCGIIPFRKTALTDAVDPIKYYEYRGMGLPVLSTRFGQMALRTEDDGVHALDAAGDVEVAARRALDHRTDAAAVARFRAENDWETRLDAADLLS
jgi:hypothetical protein